MLTAKDIEVFVVQSNAIEGIDRDPGGDIEAHLEFLFSRLTVESLQTLVTRLQPGAVLRDRPGLDVMVGNYTPPRGDYHMSKALQALLYDTDMVCGPEYTHLAYEMLHPFTDGNGRSGRALWLREMIELAPIMEGGEDQLEEIKVAGFLRPFLRQVASIKTNGEAPRFIEVARGTKPDDGFHNLRHRYYSVLRGCDLAGLYAAKW